MMIRARRPSSRLLLCLCTAHVTSPHKTASKKDQGPLTHKITRDCTKASIVRLMAVNGRCRINWEWTAGGRQSGGATMTTLFEGAAPNYSRPGHSTVSWSPMPLWKGFNLQ